MRISERLKKAAAMVMVLCTIMCMNAITAFAANDTITVSLRIEGTNSTYYYQTVEVNSNCTVEELIKQADKNSNTISVTMSAGYGGGYYVSSVNSLSEAAFGGYEGWNYLVNGNTSDIGISSYKLKDGDKVVLYYADTITTGIQHPVADTTNVSEGVIKFTSTDTVYDSNWNPSTSVNPVSGATVTWYYGTSSAKYITDINGSVQIDASQLTPGNHRIQIEKYSDNGLPVVLRNASDYTVNVKESVPTGDTVSVVNYIIIAAAAVELLGFVIIKGKNKEKTC